eukprot:TRINITY_DN1736_c0_g1_i1.p1 TRINITY_DN1736_c0_g1~~TRINITY_DN1736_c0_g1_i1.p1  ORF type:complete len:170 (+),score=46.69 TRINITY_DN1736_c0_g1_i1:56-511(+)
MAELCLVREGAVLSDDEDEVLPDGGRGTEAAAEAAESGDGDDASARGRHGATTGAVAGAAKGCVAGWLLGLAGMISGPVLPLVIAGGYTCYGAAVGYVVGQTADTESDARTWGAVGGGVGWAAAAAAVTAESLRKGGDDAVPTTDSVPTAD